MGIFITVSKTSMLGSIGVATEYISYKALDDGLGGSPTFDPPFNLNITQTEVVVE